MASNELPLLTNTDTLVPVPPQSLSNLQQFNPPPPTSSRFTFNTPSTARALTYLTLALGVLKSIPLAYIFFYYIPSTSLVSPIALQLVCIAVGAAAAGSYSKSTGGIGVWMCTTLLDAAFSTAVAALAYPIALKLVGEPDDTVNIYMYWILHCFQIYLFLGFFALLCNLLGIFFRCRSRSNSDNETPPLTPCALRSRRAFHLVVALTLLSSLFVLLLGCIELATGVAQVPPTSARPGAERPATDCDPLIPFACSLPFPSSFWTSADATSVTGQKVDLKGAIPSTRWSSSALLEKKFRARSFHHIDGFSTVAPILFGFDREINGGTLVQASNISISMDLNQSTTFLINSETNELIPHFVDKDYFDATFGLEKNSDDERRLLILQPALALQFNSTYVVVVVPGMTYKNNNKPVLIPKTGYFAALRDNVPNDPKYDPTRATQMNAHVWPTLLAVGIRRKDAVLAFSFKTVSRTSSLGKFEDIRDAALFEFDYQSGLNRSVGTSKSETPTPADGVFTYRITKVVESPTPCSDWKHTQIAKTVHGHFLSPNYLHAPGPAAVTGFMQPDSLGMFRRNGVSQVNFLIRIPCSVYNASRPVSTILQYGHGLFGSRAEALGEYLGRVANNYGMLLVATDWKGMSRYDVPMALRIFTKRIEEFSSIPERTQQGWIDNQLFLRMLRNDNIGMQHDPHLKTNGTASIPSTFLIQTENKDLSRGPRTTETPISYYGNSQGSVIGGGYFASSLDLTHAVLGVPGCPFSLLLSRSKDFAPYHGAMKLQVWDSLGVRIYLSLIQQLWDSAESGGWLTNIVNPPNKWMHPKGHVYPKKYTLLQAALGDAQVTTVAGEFMARTLKANTVQPETRYVYGVSERTAPWNVDAVNVSTSGNALVEWLYDDAPPVRRDRDLPPTDGMDTHECPRREKRAQDQIFYFLCSHQVVQTCDKGEICESKTCPSGHSKN